MMKTITLALLLIIVLSACSPAAAITPTTTPVPPTPTSTNMPQPTSPPTPEPTHTSTPEPTLTPPALNTSGKPVKIDIGGKFLTIRCYGKGSPAVVLENGFGVDWAYWETVIDGVKGSTRICAYNRSTGSNTSLEYVEDLHALLTNANIEPPYILAGHSFGGLTVILYASRFSEELAGVVLVESTHPEQWPRLLAVLPPESPGESQDLKDLRSFFTNEPKSEYWEKCSDQVCGVKSLGDTPLIVIERDPNNTSGWGAGVPIDVGVALGKVWQGLQQELVALSSNITHVIATKSGHNVPEEEPQLVIDAIRKLVNEARNN